MMHVKKYKAIDYNIFQFSQTSNTLQGLSYQKQTLFSKMHKTMGGKEPVQESMWCFSCPEVLFVRIQVFCACHRFCFV